jgi:3-(3-hydroxy-phenyl)propionate hydroxylase
MLDDLIGSGFALVSYGPEAQRALADAVALDFGMPIPVAWAILPPTINPDADAPGAIAMLRDVDGTLMSFVPDGQTIVMLVRPDRYVAAAAHADAASLAMMAKQTQALVASAA